MKRRKKGNRMKRRGGLDWASGRRMGWGRSYPKKQIH
jgi:hypothetical protein